MSSRFNVVARNERERHVKTDLLRKRKELPQKEGHLDKKEGALWGEWTIKEKESSEKLSPQTWQGAPRLFLVDRSKEVVEPF